MQNGFYTILESLLPSWIMQNASLLKVLKSPIPGGTNGISTTGMSHNSKAFNF